MPDYSFASTVQPAAGPLRREVWIDAGEFRRSLEMAFPDRVTQQSAVLRVDDGQAALEITLTPQAPRRIAALHLPTLLVEIRFVAGTTVAQRNLLARMDRAMQRGGG